MKCRHWQQTLFLHAHGQLGGFPRLLVDSHLQGCDNCRAQWARWVVERERLQRALQPAPGSDREASASIQQVAAAIRAEAMVNPASPKVAPRGAPDSVRGRQRVTLILGVALVALAFAATASVVEPGLRRAGILPRSKFSAVSSPFGISGKDCGDVGPPGLTVPAPPGMFGTVTNMGRSGARKPVGSNAVAAAPICDHCPNCALKKSSGPTAAAPEVMGCKHPDSGTTAPAAAPQVVPVTTGN